ncbi:hypothetical protein C8Q76DRAFT_245126 [Earliella scabrosa]|nr:hypothetical protein C8Q76DRAFT_245126 [Earliella scabrosa]
MLPARCQSSPRPPRLGMKKARVPVEICEQILDFVGSMQLPPPLYMDDDFFDDVVQWTTTRLACTLVCYDWLPRALVLLYRTVQLTSYAGTESLIRAILSKPYLGSFVHRIIVDYKNNEYIPWAQTLLLKKLTSLQSLHVHCSWGLKENRMYPARSLYNRSRTCARLETLDIEVQSGTRLRDLMTHWPFGHSIVRFSTTLPMVPGNTDDSVSDLASMIGYHGFNSGHRYLINRLSTFPSLSDLCLQFTDAHHFDGFVFRNSFLHVLNLVRACTMLRTLTMRLCVDPSRLSIHSRVLSELPAISDITETLSECKYLHSIQLEIPEDTATVIYNDVIWWKEEISKFVPTLEKYLHVAVWKYGTGEWFTALHALMLTTTHNVRWGMCLYPNMGPYRGSVEGEVTS